MNFKKRIKNFFNYFGLEINRHNKDIKNEDFGEILKKQLQNSSIIFDVGANNGQSIEKFSKLFPNSHIHSFEPVLSEYGLLKKKYGSQNNIYLNNFALGEIEGSKKLNITQKTETSSFNNINLGTEWLKTRSKEYNVSQDNFVKKIDEVKIITLDGYCLKNSINNIDILKIDTQGYEDKVLEGSINMIKKGNIKVIITEIILDDVYDKNFSFTDLEKYLLPYNFRIVGINMMNNNLFSSILFSADLMYFNKKHFKI